MALKRERSDEPGLPPEAFLDCHWRPTWAEGAVGWGDHEAPHGPYMFLHAQTFYVYSHEMEQDPKECQGMIRFLRERAAFAYLDQKGCYIDCSVDDSSANVLPNPGSKRKAFTLNYLRWCMGCPWNRQSNSPDLRRYYSVFP